VHGREEGARLYVRLSSNDLGSTTHARARRELWQGMASGGEGVGRRDPSSPAGAREEAVPRPTATPASNGRARGSEEERGGGGDSQGGFIAAESSLGAESAESLMNAYCEKDSGRMRLDEMVDGRMR
jgi:hypothetical protein